MGKTLNKKKLAQISIPLPPLEEQKRITAILDKADAIRRKRNLAIALTEELLRSTFLNMFGDPGRNPKGWETSKIEKLCKVETGGTPSRKNADFYQGHICWVKTTEVIGDLILDTEEKLTEEGLKASNCKIFPKNTLIIAMYGQGATRGRSAKLAVEASTNQACASILPSSEINFDYLWTYLKLSYDQLRNLGRGGNQPNLNLSMIRNFQIMTPPLSIQEKFVKSVKKIHGLQNHQVDVSSKNQELFHSLLQKAFRGEL